MALKADRLIDVTEIGYFLNEVASPGVIVSISTQGSGVALDNTSNLATVKAAGSGSTPLGMLLNEFVSIDLTRTPRNWHKDQHTTGDKCTILRKGWAVTDKVTGVPNAGQEAVLVQSGNVSGISPPVADYTRYPHVGKFLSTKDENGFARVYVDL